jgi:hypothetical protein
MRVDYDRKSFLLDGERRLVRSVSFDYFRLPSPVLWRDRIEKIRASGWNAVSIAYPWSYHSDAPGSYDWSGPRDIDLLHDMLEEAGLYLIARPGPYIGCDLGGGGLPGWVLARAASRGSHDARDPTRSPPLLRDAAEWFAAIAPRFVRRANLLCVQVEHQYEPATTLAWARTDLGASLARWLGTERWLRLLRLLSGAFVRPARPRRPMPDQSRYIAELSASLRAQGVSVPLVQTLLDPHGMRYGEVELAAVARRRLREVGLPPADAHASLLVARGDEMHLRSRRFDAPIAYAGLDAGALDRWAGAGYATVREQLLGRPLATTIITALSEGATLIDVRRFCGGMSWGYMASAGQYTSYDCGAPIAESGATDRAYDAMTQLNFWLDRHEHALCEAEPVPLDPALAEADASVYTTSRRASDQSFGFVVNMSPRPVRGVLVDAGSRTGGELPPLSAQIRAYDPEGTLMDATAQRGTIAAYSGGLQASLAGRSEPLEPPELPELSGWTLSAVSPQLDASFDDSSWELLSPAASERGELDMDTLGVHYGFLWYRGTFTGALDRLVFAARHCCAVWVNRQLVYSSDPRVPAGLFTESLAPVVLRPERLPVQEDGRNTVVILVESLGHNEGFADDFGGKVGLLKLDTGATAVCWRYRGGLVRGERGMCPLVAFDAVGRSPTQAVTLPHAWADEPVGIGLYEVRFRLTGLDPKATQLGLELDPGRGKANIYLNGLLIGRYWPERGPQHVFHLPWGIAEPDRENHLAIAVWKRSQTASLGTVRLVTQV